MTIYNKIKWILGILLVFFIVLTTNLVDRQNFSIVSSSIETIYADRLVAQDLIYEITKHLALKEVAYTTIDPTELEGNVKPWNTQIEESITLFSATLLTPKEEIIFNRLRRELKDLRESEAAITSGTKSIADLTVLLANVHEHLDDLATIQLQEGRRELQESKRAISAANLFTQLEIGGLVVMAIIIQVIILYTPKPDGDS